MKKNFTSLYSFALIALCVVIFFSSCKKRIESSPSWNTSILAPLLKSTLSLDDLLADSLLQTNGDNSVSLVFSSNLFHQSLTDQAFEIPDTAIKVGFSLENLNLANQSIIYNLSLGTIATQLGGLGQILILANGTYFPIPPLSGITSPDNDLDATQFFETADIESGSIDISIENGLPIEMSQMIFQIKNKIDQQVLTLDTFVNLSPNEIQTKVIDLAGKHVEGTLVATILDLSTPGGTVLIDTSDALIITMIAHDIKVSSATAVFPSQNLIDEDKLTTYKLSGGAALNLIRMKSGTLSIKVESTIPQKSHFEYALPSATDENGNSILVNQDLPPAPPGGTSGFTQDFDLAGYKFDLTGLTGDDHNTFFSHLVARIDSTGDVVTISKSDSIFINYELKDLVPDYINGYVGQQIVNVGPEESAFDALKSITGGSISLEDVDVNLTIRNEIGVQGRINLYNLTSINSKTGNNVLLTWNQLNHPLNIPAATDNPLAESSTSFLLNNTNSNIQQLVSNLPDKLQYQLDLFLNPYGNTSNYNDFAYDSSELNVDLDLSIPLSFVATDLTLVDTLDFSLGVAEPGDAQIKDGTFNLIVYNGFPISAQPQLYLYDDDFNLIDSLFMTAQTVAAGELNDQCLVAAKTKSVLTTAIDENKMARLRTATKAILHAKFNTALHPNCDYVKIYNTYTMDVQLTGLFTFFTGY